MQPPSPKIPQVLETFTSHFQDYGGHIHSPPQLPPAPSCQRLWWRGDSKTIITHWMSLLTSTGPPYPGLCPSSHFFSCLFPLSPARFLHFFKVGGLLGFSTCGSGLRTAQTGSEGTSIRKTVWSWFQTVREGEQGTVSRLPVVGPPGKVVAMEGWSLSRAGLAGPWRPVAW